MEVLFKRKSAKGLKMILFGILVAQFKNIDALFRNMAFSTEVFEFLSLPLNQSLICLKYLWDTLNINYKVLSFCKR